MREHGCRLLLYYPRGLGFEVWAVGFDAVFVTCRPRGVNSVIHPPGGQQDRHTHTSSSAS
jgi:hypothetical protein